MDRTAEWKINKLLMKCDKCEVECTVKGYRKFDCSTGHQGIVCTKFFVCLYDYYTHSTV